ncbi:MAG TPA: MBL fold metallo-hydrolase [Tepidisphaeraceae bacterium]|nr:MBL fold metallo-hydrolase [Tepidisphaeraceae bacterium]
MQILMNTGGIAATNCFLVADEEAKQAVLFDAPDHTAGPLLGEAERRGWDVVGLWLTHGHFDHVADHVVVTKRNPRAKVLIHKLDEPKLLRPKENLPPIFQLLPITIPGGRADGYLEDGQKLSIGALELEVIFTPGHAPGHVMFYFPKEKLLIGGDLIIGGAVGRTDLPDSDPVALDASIRRVMQLPPDTRLLPGHGELSTLGEEREMNPYVRGAMGLNGGIERDRGPNE